MEETAVNLAHRHANVAEEYEERNQLVEAIEAHTLAAATQDTRSVEVIRTLKLMNTKHLRQAKDLQRKVAKKQAAVDAAAAAETVRPAQTSNSTKSSDNSSTASSGSRTSGTTHSGMSGRRRSSSEHQQHHHQHQYPQHHHTHHPHYVQHQHHHRYGSQPHDHYPQHHSSTKAHSSHLVDTLDSHGSHKSIITGDQLETSGQDSLAAAAGSSTGKEPGTSVSSGASSNSSSAMIEESYTLVRDHVQKTHISNDPKDDSDPFNKFLEAVENLVLKISSPVAFTSIPLNPDDPNFGSAVPQQRQQLSPLTEDPPALTSSLSSTTHHTTAVGAGSNIKQYSTQEVQDRQEQQPQQQQARHSQAISALKTTTSRKIDPAQQQRPIPNIRLDPSAMQESFFIIDSPSTVNGGGSKHLSRSRSASETTAAFSTTTFSSISIPSNRTIGSTSSTKTLEEYAIENQQLKLTLDRLSRKNQKLEKQMEGAMQMSVWQKDIQRSALQLIKSQDILRPCSAATASALLTRQQHHSNGSSSGSGSSSQESTATVSGAPMSTSMATLSKNIVNNNKNAATNTTTNTHLTPESATIATTTASTSTSTAAAAATCTAATSNETTKLGHDDMNPRTLQHRVQELTEELYTLKLENAKQVQLMKKYKQRWEDLKESAKKRRNLPPSSSSTSPIPLSSGPTFPSSPDVGGGSAGNSSSGGNSSLGHQHHHHHHHHHQHRHLDGAGGGGGGTGGRNAGINPYSSASLAGNPGSSPNSGVINTTAATGLNIINNNINTNTNTNGPTRPMINLARSSSASGPVLTTHGSYQRRILMESNKSGYNPGGVMRTQHLQETQEKE
ncbi:hypothetical protein BG004_007744 [Podila humilis]|nr:hypothetical protein BG004_007744 [Podila humilis]